MNNRPTGQPAEEQLSVPPALIGALLLLAVVLALLFIAAAQLVQTP